MDDPYLYAIVATIAGVGVLEAGRWLAPILEKLIDEWIRERRSDGPETEG